MQSKRRNLLTHGKSYLRSRTSAKLLFSTRGSGKQVSMTVIGRGAAGSFMVNTWKGEGICRPWSKVFEMYRSGLAIPPTSWRGAIWQEKQGHRNSDMGFSVLIGYRERISDKSSASISRTGCIMQLPATQNCGMPATQDSISLGHLSAQLNITYWNSDYPRNGAPSVGTNHPTQWSWI